VEICADAENKINNTVSIPKGNTIANNCNISCKIISDNKVKMLVLNARSMVKIEKRLELEAYVKINGYKVIAITESWATSDISTTELGMEGFVLFRKDRSEVKDGRGGGVILYVSEELTCTAADKLNSIKCEAVWVELQDKLSGSVTVGVCYRSPVASEQEVQEMFRAVTEASKGRCLIVGDFNYPTINWQSFESATREDEKFVDLLQDNFLFQHVHTATRDKNILDLVISSEISMVDDLRVREHFASSDHNMIDFEFVLHTGVSDSVIYKFDYNHSDFHAIRDALSEINWCEKFKDKNTLESYTAFSSKLHEVIDAYVPVKKLKTKKKCLWLTKKVRSAIKKRNKKWKFYCVSRSDTDYAKYKQCRNAVVRELRKARKNFESKLAADIKNNPKSFFRYVRSKTKSKDRVGPLKDSSGKILDDEKSMCEQLNTFFLLYSQRKTQQMFRRSNRFFMGITVSFLVQLL